MGAQSDGAVALELVDRPLDGVVACWEAAAIYGLDDEPEGASEHDSQHAPAAPDPVRRPGVRCCGGPGERGAS